MATDKPRFTITVPEDVLSEIEDYQEANGISTRSKAIQSLIERGIDELIANGTLKREDPPITKDEALLLECYKGLNDEGREKLLDYAEDLASLDRYKKRDRARQVEEA